MKDLSSINYDDLDCPEVTNFLFHPRIDHSPISYDPLKQDLLIPTEPGISIGACLYHCAKNAPTILYFHGNGEIVADYTDIGPMYVDIGINFLVVDYRGYGKSSGSPSVTGMIRDCHYIFHYVKNWLHNNKYQGKLLIMGRSLGSACAIEIAANYENEFDALIIESGFAFSIPLFTLIGIDVNFLDITEKQGTLNLEKIKNFTKPTLIIHAEYDHIIPFYDGQALFDACLSKSKKLIKIQSADHNTIFYYGMKLYMESIKGLTKDL